MSGRAREQIFAEFDRWGYDERGLAPTTRYKYFTVARAADAWLVANRQTSLAFASVKDLKAYLFAQPTCARSRNRTRQALVAFGEFMLSKGIGDLNPALSLPRLPEPELLPKALTVEEGRRIVQSAHLLGTMADALVGVYLFGALRKTEGRTLQWPMIGPDGWLRFRGKGSRTRTVPLHPLALASLYAWKVECRNPRWVFPSPRRQDQPISDTHVRAVLWEVGELAGIHHLHPHLLRHTAATRLLENGADLRTVQEFLGHADPKNTALYTKVRPPRLMEAVVALDFGLARAGA